MKALFARGPKQQKLTSQDVEPQPLALRRAADDGQHVRQAGAPPHPRLRIDALSQRKDLARQGLDALELHRARRGIAQRELGACREADALGHGGERIAVRDVDDGPVERGIALRLEMHVIAALDAERQAHSERTVDVVGPGAQRHHHRAGRDRPFGGAHLPAAAQWSQRPRVALYEAPAALLEQAGVGLHDRPGIRHADGLGHQHAADLGAAQVRLQLGQLVRADGSEIDTVGLEIALALADVLLQRPGGAVEAQIAGAPDHAEDAGLGHQRLVLPNAMLDQRPRRVRGGRQTVRRGGAPVVIKPGRDRRQRAPMQVGLGPQVESVLGHEPDVARERVGHHALALDDAGVAVARLLARAPPVDQHDRAAALLQVQCGRRADDAGAEHDDIGIEGGAQGASRGFLLAAGGGGLAFPHYMTNLALMRQSGSATASLCPKTCKRRP